MQAKTEVFVDALLDYSLLLYLGVFVKPMYYLVIPLHNLNILFLKFFKKLHDPSVPGRYNFLQKLFIKIFIAS